ncbi:MAG: LarC family nickel insertion protein, partial [Clostridiaceae bacterium]|nr:LarC family nickel insertion protein [Clostridiaceae bacterium]
KKASPEYEDCRKIAEDNGLPLMKAYTIVSQDAARHLGI